MILHLLCWDTKFVPSFISFIQKNFIKEPHKFIVYGEFDVDSICELHNVDCYQSLLKNILALSKAMTSAKKIFLHGLFCSHLLYLLFLQPWLLKKCHWVIWGGDLYIHASEKKDWRWYKNEFFRRFAIKRIGHLVTYVEGDADLARQWYGATGQYQECLMYPSNLYKECESLHKENSTINIQVGNSADPSNNHLEVFEKILAYKNQDINIFVPLSYGDKIYANKITKIGNKMFGNKFIPITKFLAPDKYIMLLGLIDISVFAHRRQQGMGNIITLLGLGKKVFIRNNITPWNTFNKHKIKVFDINYFNLDALDALTIKQNKVKVKEYFSHINLCKQWQNIFESK